MTCMIDIIILELLKNLIREWEFWSESTRSMSHDESSRSAPWVSIASRMILMMQHSKHGWLAIDPWLDPANGRMPAACGSVLYTWDNLLIGKIYIDKKKLIETNATLAEKKLHIQSPGVGFVSITFFFLRKGAFIILFFSSSICPKTI